ncbi:MAG: cytochrome b/b6 domain-containing protein [Polymorphobacter sp.]
MTSFYLGLAVVLAVTLNLPWAIGRALGNLVAGVALAFMAGSIALANMDGTFAKAPAGSRMPLLLNAEAVLMVAAAALLLLTIPRQLRHATPAPLPLHSTTTAYGMITRALHWLAATLIIAAFTMGQFLAVLRPDAPERPDFLATHMAVGGAIFLLTFARMFVRLIKPAPPNPDRVHFAHFLLYAVITAFCVTGLALTPVPVPLLGLSLPNLPPDPIAGPLHHRSLPLLFLLLVGLHLFGAVKAIRRMAR